MGRRWKLVLTLLVAVTARSAVAATTTLPGWQRQPTAAQTAAVYPARAQMIGVGGTATIHCAVTVAGDLHDCSVYSEAPARLDFGAAALKLVPFMKMTPKLQDNIPVEGTVTIPIRFSAPEAGKDGLLAGGPVLFKLPDGR